MENRKCIVWKTTLKQDIRYEGIFHGFFQTGHGEYHDDFDIEPRALVEKENGSVVEISVQFFSFKVESTMDILLKNLPSYKAGAVGLSFVD